MKAEDSIDTSTKDLPVSDKAVVSEVKAEDSIATSSKDMPVSDKTVVSRVKAEDSIATPTKDLPVSDKAVVSEVKTEDEKLAIVLTSTPNESVKTDSVTSSPTVIDPLK
ncbi:MAG: hypothetical protein EAZ45_25175 [Oscillatoriales cyanobacterium]|nr:MAG: hypothetical protein EAZ45_25175 [Oscillatoriales cyanobacterium]